MEHRKQGAGEIAWPAERFQQFLFLFIQEISVDLSAGYWLQFDI